MEVLPVYLDSYTLQSDSRIRLPKSVITNLQAIPGKTRFDIYYDNVSNSVILKICSENIDEEEKNG